MTSCLFQAAPDQVQEVEYTFSFLSLREGLSALEINGDSKPLENFQDQGTVGLRIPEKMAISWKGMSSSLASRIISRAISRTSWASLGAERN